MWFYEFTLYYEHTNYIDMLQKITSVYKEVTNTSMHIATNDFQFKQNDENIETSNTVNENSIADITVSGDGSWQKREF